jgi:hypothetical protein
MMLQCDSVLMLPGWQHSKGATIERFVAEACAMPITELMQMDLDTPAPEQR